MEIDWRHFTTQSLVAYGQGDQKYAGKMRDQFLKMRHKMRAYLILLLNKNIL